jgi:Carbohydrate family 9 binding domain-like
MRLLLCSLAIAWTLNAQPPCTVSEVSEERAIIQVPHMSGHPGLSLNPASWKRATSQSMSKDCSRQIDYPNLKTEIRAFWTDSDLYVFFRCPFTDLNLFLPAEPGKDRIGLWDRDVVEMFFGDDWVNTRHYREFEISPTGDRVDLAIDLDHKGEGAAWDSGWETKARIDKGAKVWYAAARIPLSSVTKTVKRGDKWRVNLYRIDGLGADPVRHFMCWQPTCVQKRDPNHVPEHFGTLIFGK